jgi:hypothetical protein
VPRIVVYADTSSLDVFAFLDSLMSNTYSSDQKKQILKEFEIINEQAVEENTERETTVTRKRLTINLGGETAVQWEGQAKYIKYVTSSATAIGGERVYGAYGGGIAVAKQGKTVVLFHVMSEWDFFAPIMNEAMTMLKSLQWAQPQKEGEKGK